jgi:hypothetical protein
MVTIKIDKLLCKVVCNFIKKMIEFNLIFIIFLVLIKIFIKNETFAYIIVTLLIFILSSHIADYIKSLWIEIKNM